MVTETVVQKERIVAVGLLTQRDLNLLGQSFTRAWPIEEAPFFDGLIRAIDEADAMVKPVGEQSS